MKLPKALTIVCLLMIPLLSLGETAVATVATDMYKGMDQGGDIIGQIARGTAVEVLAAEGDWYYIAYGTKYGWVLARDFREPGERKTTIVPATSSSTFKKFTLGVSVGFGSATQTLNDDKSGSNFEYGINAGYRLSDQSKLGLDIRSRSRLIIDPFTSGSIGLRFDHVLDNKYNIGLFATRDSYSNGTSDALSSSTLAFGGKSFGRVNPAAEYHVSWRNEIHSFEDDDQNYNSNQLTGRLAFGKSIGSRLILSVQDYIMSHSTDGQSFHRIIPGLVLERRADETSAFRVIGELDAHNAETDLDTYMKLTGRIERTSERSDNGLEVVSKNFPNDTLRGFLDLHLFMKRLGRSRSSVDFLYRIQQSEYVSDYYETKLKNSSTLGYRSSSGFVHESEIYGKIMTASADTFMAVEHTLRGFIFLGLKSRQPDIALGPLFGANLVLDPDVEGTIVETRSELEYGGRLSIGLPRMYDNKTTASVGYIIIDPLAEGWNNKPGFNLRVMSQQVLFKKYVIHVILEKYHTKVGIDDEPIDKFSYHVKFSYQFR
jgi:uncharacterized protein YraI